MRNLSGYTSNLAKGIMLIMLGLLSLTACTNEANELLESEELALSSEQLEAAEVRKTRLELLQELDARAGEVRTARNAVIESMTTTYLNRGEYADAERIALSALDVGPNDVVVLRNIARVYEAWGNDEQAVEYTRRAEGVEGGGLHGE
jgi:tetratricopeptide (TPR) repeat protein